MNLPTKLLAAGAGAIALSGCVSTFGEPLSERRGSRYASNEMVCQSEARTGSRIAKDEVCMTERQWERVREESQENQRELGGGAPPELGLPDL